MMELQSQNQLISQLSLFVSLQEDLHCRYSLARTRLENLLTAVDSRQFASSHVQYYLKKIRKNDQDWGITQSLQRLSAAPATAESGPEGNNSPAEGAGNADKRVSGGSECGAEFTAVLHRQAAYDVGEPAGHPAKYDNSRSINTPATLASLHQPQPTDQRVVVQTPVSAGYAENPGFYWSVAGQDLWQSVLVGQLPWLNAA